MLRTEILQTLINKIQAKRYLEIGVGPGMNFRQINCEHKVSVDPNPTVPVTFKVSSDDFFNQNTDNFDVIFIDGLHWSKQVYKDILNSLDVLTENGYIVCHDMNPESEFVQRYPQPKPSSPWTGDCWKAWVKLRTERDDLLMYVIDTDCGCGVITKGKQERLTVDSPLTWELLDNNRANLLNLVSVDTFLKEI